VCFAWAQRGRTASSYAAVPGDEIHRVYSLPLRGPARGSCDCDRSSPEAETEVESVTETVKKSSERRSLRVADVLAEQLAASGIRYAFGHPGGEVAVLMDALEQAGLKYVLTHHEATAAFMAQGVGELTGTPGLCVATLGPGATNLVTGVANALLDRSPLLAITGSLATDGPLGKTHQDLDLLALFKPLTKATFIVTDHNASTVIDEAFAISLAEPRGPVHLALPSDVAGSTCVIPKQRTFKGVRQPERTTELYETGIDLSRRRLEQAQRIAIVAGLRANTREIADALCAFAQSVHAVIAVTPKAKGVFPERDSSFAGVIEMAGDDIVIDLLQKADLVVTVGLDVVELDKPWRLGASILDIDSVHPGEPRYFEAEVELYGDIASALSRLSSVDANSRWAAEELSEHRRRLGRFISPASDMLSPSEVVATVQRHFPDETIVVTDTGAHKFLVAQAWCSTHPNTYFLSNGLSSMGYGLPVAAAASLAQMERPVVAFVGDGGLTMYLGELETLSRLGIDLTVIVFIDNSLELIRRSQLARGLPEAGTHFANPDYALIASAYGIHGHRAANAEALDDAIEAARQDGGIHIVAAEIDRNAYQL